MAAETLVEGILSRCGSAYFRGQTFKTHVQRALWLIACCWSVVFTESVLPIVSVCTLNFQVRTVHMQ